MQLYGYETAMYIENVSINKYISFLTCDSVLLPTSHHFWAMHKNK